MKQILQGIVLGSIALLTILSVMVVSGRDRAEKELKEALSTTLSETLENMAITGVYSIEDEDAFKADFVELFIDQMNLHPFHTGTDGEVVTVDDDALTLRIDFAVADVEKEILMVHVIERVKYPNGSDAVVEDSAAVVFNEESELREYAAVYRIAQEEIESRKLASSEVFHSYEEEEGQHFHVPEAPRDEDGREHPVRWICVSAPADGRSHVIRTNEESPRSYTSEELRALTIDGDYVFQAVFEEAG